MKIVIENTKFPYDFGCRLLKLKHDTCPFAELEEIWDDIVPLTFKEIAELENLEQRRVGILCLGLERLVKEVQPTLLNKKTVNKKTTWINEKGVLEKKTFKDTYELYEVSGSYFSKGLESWRKVEDAHFVKCKDTSTNREYLIWVDIKSVAETNGQSRWDFKKEKVNAIQAIAWTIQTNVAEGNIEKIIRQGDCVLIKPKNPNAKMLEAPRHLTEKEYLKLLVAES
ncbi:MAG: hypothetical protein KatS3mg035_1042 [Bacteroidia bacterium]|nr:MAG: hypothetical protein KatS3mg035_1042 [Bacteroidia bacterium]